jgi:hypothetical protein
MRADSIPKARLVLLSIAISLAVGGRVADADVTQQGASLYWVSAATTGDQQLYVNLSGAAQMALVTVCNKNSSSSGVDVKVSGVTQMSVFRDQCKTIQTIVASAASLDVKTQGGTDSGTYAVSILDNGVRS